MNNSKYWLLIVILVSGQTAMAAGQVDVSLSVGSKASGQSMLVVDSVTGAVPCPDGAALTECFQINPEDKNVKITFELERDCRDGEDGYGLSAVYLADTGRAFKLPNSLADYAQHDFDADGYGSPAPEGSPTKKKISIKDKNKGKPDRGGYGPYEVNYLVEATNCATGEVIGFDPRIRNTGDKSN